jgi:transposase-like protein
MAAAFLARVWAGETINSLIGQPGMPDRATYNFWKGDQAPFCEAVNLLVARRDQALGQRGRARFRPFDPALADRIRVRAHYGGTLLEILAADPELPSPPTVRRWRREQPAFERMLQTALRASRRKRAAVRGCTPAMREAVLERIVMGGSFASIGREPGMPSRQTLRKWVRASPQFAAEVAQACEHREDWYLDQITLIAEAAGPGNLAAARRRMAPLTRQLARLKHRPGSVHRRRASAPG